MSGAKKDSRLKEQEYQVITNQSVLLIILRSLILLLLKKASKVKTIRFGQKGAKTAGKPKAGESARMKAKRKSFKARHAKNIKKGKMSAAYWADKVKW